MGPWCPLFDLHLPRLRFPIYGFLATGSPRLTAFLAPLSPAKLPVSYPFFLSSPGTNFGPTDFCHLRRRSNLLICLFAIFGLNDYVVLFCFNSVTSKCGSWYADCRALCPGPSSQEDRALAAWSKKKYWLVFQFWCSVCDSLGRFFFTFVLFVFAYETLTLGSSYDLKLSGTRTATIVMGCHL